MSLQYLQAKPTQHAITTDNAIPLLQLASKRSQLLPTSYYSFILSTPHYYQLHQLHPTTYYLPITYYLLLSITTYYLPTTTLSLSFFLIYYHQKSSPLYYYLPLLTIPTYYLPTYYLPTTYYFFSIASLLYYPPPYLLLIIITTYLLLLNFPTSLLFFISNFPTLLLTIYLLPTPLFKITPPPIK